MTEEKKAISFKVFDLYDVEEVVIEDVGLKSMINLQPKLVPKSHGRNIGKLSQVKTNIVERLINRIAVAGHRGKKHKLQKKATGKYSKNAKIILEVFEIIAKRTGKNPIQVLVKAIENSAPRDETTVIEYGGARYPQAVDVSPLRRVNLALRWITQGSSEKAFNKKKTIIQALVDEIVMASEGNQESFAVKKKKESEAQADSAR